MMPELRPEAIELVEKVKTFIKDEVNDVNFNLKKIFLKNYWSIH